MLEKRVYRSGHLRILPKKYLRHSGRRTNTSTSDLITFRHLNNALWKKVCFGAKDYARPSKTARGKKALQLCRSSVSKSHRSQTLQRCLKAWPLPQAGCAPGMGHAGHLSVGMGHAGRLSVGKPLATAAAPAAGRERTTALAPDPHWGGRTSSPLTPSTPLCAESSFSLCTRVRSCPLFGRFTLVLY